MSDEACRLAQNLARNRGYAVFPCRDDKTPTTPHGFKDGSTDPERIAWLWRRYPGPLIGVATGERSGISVVDVDSRHETARLWWAQNCHRLPDTPTYRTRSGGIHLWFRHTPGVGTKAGHPVQGIDVRGDGGLIIFWFGAGFDCLDHSPPAPWPAWLTTFFWPPPKPVQQSPTRPAEPISDKLLAALKENAIERVRGAKEGQMHYAVRAAGCTLGAIAKEAGFTKADAVDWIVNALPDNSNARDSNAKKTAAWGFDKGGAGTLRALEGR